MEVILAVKPGERKQYHFFTTAVSNIYHIAILKKALHLMMRDMRPFKSRTTPSRLRSPLRACHQLLSCSCPPIGLSTLPQLVRHNQVAHFLCPRLASRLHIHFQEECQCSQWCMALLHLRDPIDWDMILSAMSLFFKLNLT